MSEPEASSEATRLLKALAGGEASDVDRLLALVYDELRRLAGHYLDRERADHTLQPTALVHEAYLRLIEQDRVEWQGRAHFMGIAAQAMRRILVDHARGRGRAKRGGGWNRVDLEPEIAASGVGELDLVEVDRMLDRLAELAPRQARIVEMRFFAGLPVEAVAEALGVSPRTVEREWRFAKAWLLKAMRDGADGSERA